jgi:hypothetical protein
VTSVAHYQQINVRFLQVMHERLRGMTSTLFDAYFDAALCPRRLSNPVADDNSRDRAECSRQNASHHVDRAE